MNEFSDGDRVQHATWSANGSPLTGHVDGNRVVWDGNRGWDEVASIASDLTRI